LWRPLPVFSVFKRLRVVKVTSHQLNPLKTEFLHSFIYKFSSYLTGNTSPLQSPSG
jgi:hypothetical protein